MAGRNGSPGARLTQDGNQVNLLTGATVKKKFQLLVCFCNFTMHRIDYIQHLSY